MIRRRLPCSFSTIAAVLLSTGLAFAEPSPMKTGQEQTGGFAWFGSGLASLALRYEGKTAAQLGLPRSLWCGDFASMIRRKAGLKAPTSRRAIDQTLHARRIARPVPDALMITPRGRGGSHVDFIVSVNANGTVTTVGGNVDRRVTVRVLPARGLFFLPS